MPIPESGQTVDGVLEGITAALASVLGLTQDPTTLVWAGIVNGTSAALCEGDVGAAQADLIVAVGNDGGNGGIIQAISRPTLGTNRSREIACEVKIGFDLLVYGADIAARTARQKLDAVLEPVQLYFRTTGNERLTVGGVDSCRDSWVSAIDGPNVANAVDSTGNVVGRHATAFLTITALVRN